MWFPFALFDIPRLWPHISFLRLSYCLFACRIEKTMHVFSKIWRFVKVYTREICQPSHSRKFISAKLSTLKVYMKHCVSSLYEVCQLISSLFTGLHFRMLINANPRISHRGFNHLWWWFSPQLHIVVTAH